MTPQDLITLLEAKSTEYAKLVPIGSEPHLSRVASYVRGALGPGSMNQVIRQLETVPMACGSSFEAQLRKLARRTGHNLCGDSVAGLINAGHGDYVDEQRHAETRKRIALKEATKDERKANRNTMIRADREAGMPFRQIAEKYELGVATVHAITKETP